jgi:hypothetical protein
MALLCLAAWMSMALGMNWKFIRSLSRQDSEVRCWLNFRASFLWRNEPMMMARWSSLGLWCGWPNLDYCFLRPTWSQTKWTKTINDVKGPRSEQLTAQISWRNTKNHANDNDTQISLPLSQYTVVTVVEEWQKFRVFATVMPTTGSIYLSALSFLEPAELLQIY